MVNEPVFSVHFSSGVTSWGLVEAPDSPVGEYVDLTPLEMPHEISRVSYQIALLQPALHLFFPAKAGGLWTRRVRDQRHLRSCGTVRFELWKMWAVGGFFIQKCGQDMPRSVINWSEEEWCNESGGWTWSVVEASKCAGVVIVGNQIHWPRHNVLATVVTFSSAADSVGFWIFLADSDDYHEHDWISLVQAGAQLLRFFLMATRHSLIMPGCDWLICN